MKLFKNRTVLGIFCIAVSLIICFAITPLVNAGLSKKVTIVRFNKQVNEGEEITRNMLDVVEVGNHNLPENVIRNVADVEGKYLTTTVYAGDYILTDKISDEPAAENKYLYSLNGEKQAMSITINTFAEGLSGKLKSGDIVSVIAPDYLGSGETIIPVETDSFTGRGRGGNFQQWNAGERHMERDGGLPFPEETLQENGI